MKKIISTFVASGFFLLLVPGCSKPESPSTPNIILIMSDDMGYSDIGCYGGEINTPNLDKLAKNGLQFMQFYNTARCCPTRASLISGLYPHQTGIGHMTNTPADFTQHDLNIPQYRGFLNKNSVTIAEVLKDAGYTTLMTGKWHLGVSTQDKWPLQRGFDKFYGIIPGACNFFKPEYPRGITVGNDTITITDENYYTTDAFTENAIKFIGESRQESEKPFFLYLAYNAPHWPLNAPTEDIEKYRGKYMKGWQDLRLWRYKNMIEKGLIDKDWELTPQDSRDWNSLTDEKKVEMDLRKAIYSAMVDRMDQNIGKLVAYLEKENILDNTIIMFLNDNGACAEFSELGDGPAEQLGTKEGYILSYGRAWANASNTPYREYKHWVHEGGISTPFIVHWPNGIPKEDNGMLVQEYGFLPDIMATCVDLAHAEYPKEYKGNSIQAMVGKSLLPVISGEIKPVHTEPIFWEHEGNKAVRNGKYKLVQTWKANKENNWELYDLSQDRTEMHDLSQKMPEKLKEMTDQYNEWAEKMHVLPWDSIQSLYKAKNNK
jgi:arylsulfatase A-like enzyme